MTRFQYHLAISNLLIKAGAQASEHGRIARDRRYRKETRAKHTAKYKTALDLMILSCNELSCLEN